MKTVKVNNGHVKKYKNGAHRRSFGANISFAATDVHIDY